MRIAGRRALVPNRDSVGDHWGFPESAVRDTTIHLHANHVAQRWWKRWMLGLLLLHHVVHDYEICCFAQILLVFP